MSRPAPTTCSSTVCKVGPDCIVNQPGFRSLACRQGCNLDSTNDNEWVNDDIKGAIPGEARKTEVVVDIGLDQERMKSLAKYSQAPFLERACLFAIAASTSPQDLDQFRSAFIEVDSDGDGLISYRDLSIALDRAAWFMLPVDADVLFKATDLDRNGTLDFTEFVAALLHSRLAPLDEWLAQQAFEALDRDRDGLLTAQDVLSIFGMLPDGLPSYRVFGLNEWIGCLLRRSGMPPGHSTSSVVSAGLEPAGFFATFFGGCQRSDDDSFNFNIDSNPALSSAFNPDAASEHQPHSQYYQAPAQSHYPLPPVPPPPMTRNDRFVQPQLSPMQHLSSPSYMPSRGPRSRQ